MSISDRLDKIDSVTPYLDDDDMEAEVLAATAALRSVIDLHKPEKFMDFEDTCSGCDIGTLDPPTWPCPTVRAVQAALGEEA